jgi:hypothetical protein
MIDVVQNRFKILLLLLMFLAVIVNFAFYTNFGYALGGDQGLNVQNAAGVISGLYTWQIGNYSGLASILNSIFGEIVSLFSLGFYKINLVLGYDLIQSTFTFIGLSGMFLLTYELTSKYVNKIRYLAAFFASVVFAINFFSHLSDLSIPIGIFLPWIFLFIIRLFFKDVEINTHKRDLFGLVISITLFISVGGSGYFIFNCILLVLLAILTLLFAERKSLYRNIKYILIIVALTAMINASWIVTTYSFIHHIGHTFFGSGSQGTLSATALDLMQTMLSFGPWITSSNLQYVPTLVGILAIALFSVFSIRKDNTNNKIVYSLLFLYVFMVALATTISMPFGQIFSGILKYFPYLLTLRYPYFATHYVFLFLVSALFGVGLATIMDYLISKKHNAFLNIGFVVFVIVLVSSYLYFFDYLPIAAQNSAVNIPQHVFDISNYINAQNGTFSVATIPVDPNWQIDNWYVGVNVYSSLINSPVYTGGYTYYNEIFLPNTKGMYDDFASVVQDTNMTNKSVSNVFGALGVRYIIVQGDALNKSPCEYCYVMSFNKTDMYGNLNASRDLSFIRKYGNSSIYENRNYVPMVYAADVQNLGNISSSEILSALENGNFDIQNNAIYSTDAFGLFNTTGKMNVSSIQDFSQPNVTFDYNTPTHAFVYVRNATTPYYLVFRETYDPYWHAYYPNGTAVPSRDHIAVNGFANAWYIDKPGNYTISLYYTLQTEAWIAWIISFAGLGITLYIGYLGWKEMKKEKGVEGMLNRIERKGSGR